MTIIILLKSKIIWFLKKMHYTLPYAARQFYRPLINFSRKTRLFFPRLYYIEGEEHSSGNKMKLIYLGHDERILKYWTELIFSQNTTIRTNSYLPLWRIKIFLHKNNGKSDLAIVELNNITKNAISLKSGFILPRWLDMRIDIDRSLKTKQIHHIKYQIRRYGLTYENRYTLSDLDYFYNRMYIPYTAQRYKDASVTADYDYFANIFKKKGSRLFFILRDGVPVAGSFDIKKGKKVFMHSLGILDARQDLLKMGVLGSSYYFKMLDYKNKNYNSLDIGGTCPILTNGLTQHKITLGAEVVVKNIRKQFIMLIPIHDSITIKKFLKSNPFVYLKNNSHYCAVFTMDEDESEEKDFLRLIKQTKSINIRKTVVYCFNGINTISRWLKTDPESKAEFTNYKIGDRIMY